MLLRYIALVVVLFSNLAFADLVEDQHAVRVALQKIYNNEFDPTESPNIDDVIVRLSRIENGLEFYVPTQAENFEQSATSMLIQFTQKGFNIRIPQEDLATHFKDAIYVPANSDVAIYDSVFGPVTLNEGWLKNGKPFHWACISAVYDGEKLSSCGPFNAKGLRTGKTRVESRYGTAFYDLSVSDDRSIGRNGILEGGFKGFENESNRASKAEAQNMVNSFIKTLPHLNYKLASTTSLGWYYIKERMNFLQKSYATSRTRLIILSKSGLMFKVGGGYSNRGPNKHNYGRELFGIMGCLIPESNDSPIVNGLTQISYEMKCLDNATRWNSTTAGTGFGKDVHRLRNNHDFRGRGAFEASSSSGKGKGKN